MQGQGIRLLSRQKNSCFCKFSHLSFIYNFIISFYDRVLILMAVDVLLVCLAAAQMATPPRTATILKGARTRSCPFLLQMSVGWRRIVVQTEISSSDGASTWSMVAARGSGTGARAVTGTTLKPRRLAMKCAWTQLANM